MYAHSLTDQPPDRWQPLDVHASAVAGMADMFAQPFHSGAWASLSGSLHDIGKARVSFQNYLRFCNNLTDADYDASDRTHSGAGAVWAVQALSRNKVGRLLAYIIAGHHAGLPDWIGG
ncbi:MAG: CRISPR-associated endonuclease Cas3'', partial [Lentisphaerae bacterium]|nr:CRISPR-associated endonuclease Cas3'' [Lentisphaerota bacterium]